ncbi:MAG: transporter substrate-binding domain-containing protein [Brevibacterium sp.]|nr:transporter substrate-binding domain-containing protein [Brevibacterium sp.]
MKKGNAELKKAVDDTIKEIKDNGEYDKIYEKWFGDAPK